MTATAAEQARDEAMRRVDEAADDEWRDWAHVVVAALAVGIDNGPLTFTTDDVWERLSAYDARAPREPRALGPVMAKFRKAGVIEPTGEYVRSRRVECHARPVPVYRSLIRA